MSVEDKLAALEVGYADPVMGDDYVMQAVAAIRAVLEAANHMDPTHANTVHRTIQEAMR